jgi:hypothetical protein
MKIFDLLIAACLIAVCWEMYDFTICSSPLDLIVFVDVIIDYGLVSMVLKCLYLDDLQLLT